MTYFNLDIENYNYSLPEERVAKYPLEKRDGSNLLIKVPDQNIFHTRFCNIADYLPENSLLIYNNTKVIHARLLFQKKTGALIEIFCLSPYKPSDYQAALSSTKASIWKCMIGNSKKWKEGNLGLTIYIKQVPVTLIAKRLLNKEKNSQVIEFSWNTGHTFAEILEAAGKIPIPPYLNRDSEDIDKQRYQTVYSEYPGSVAAPTAGLHFSDKTLELLARKKIKINEVTLHVGAGTFQPVKDKNARNHKMHGEQIVVQKKLLEEIINHKGKIIATGTTTLRSLESLYWLGVKAIKKKDVHTLKQWEWEVNDKNIPLHESITSLVEEMNKNKTDILRANTEIMIIPGYQFRATDILITNFHQPKSTLLLLIAAFIGNQWKDIYNYALQNNFRFLSYGDSCLLFR